MVPDRHGEETTLRAADKRAYQQHGDGRKYPDRFTRAVHRPSASALRIGPLATLTEPTSSKLTLIQSKLAVDVSIERFPVETVLSRRPPFEGPFTDGGGNSGQRLRACVGAEDVAEEGEVGWGNTAPEARFFDADPRRALVLRSNLHRRTGGTSVLALHASSASDEMSGLKSKGEKKAAHRALIFALLTIVFYTLQPASPPSENVGTTAPSGVQASHVQLSGPVYTALYSGAGASWSDPGAVVVSCAGSSAAPASTPDGPVDTSAVGQHRYIYPAGDARVERLVQVRSLPGPVADVSTFSASGDSITVSFGGIVSAAQPPSTAHFNWYFAQTSLSASSFRVSLVNSNKEAKDGVSLVAVKGRSSDSFITQWDLQLDVDRSAVASGDSYVLAPIFAAPLWECPQLAADLLASPAPTWNATSEASNSETTNSVLFTFSGPVAPSQGQENSTTPPDARELSPDSFLAALQPSTGFRKRTRRQSTACAIEGQSLPVEAVQLGDGGPGSEKPVRPTRAFDAYPPKAPVSCSAVTITLSKTTTTASTVSATSTESESSTISETSTASKTATASESLTFSESSTTSATPTASESSTFSESSTAATTSTASSTFSESSTTTTSTTTSSTSSTTTHTSKSKSTTTSTSSNSKQKSTSTRSSDDSEPSESSKGPPLDSSRGGGGGAGGGGGGGGGGGVGGGASLKPLPDPFTPLPIAPTKPSPTASPKPPFRPLPIFNPVKPFKPLPNEPLPVAPAPAAPAAGDSGDSDNEPLL
ncbi:hypothetical protein BDK51DRAFT_40399 [Blyttiomyces helicus]|uniref:Uncharacterized protein n=1 Tax=Blyttiomyces helicus TaxID=388810 RepID=A0A4P9WL19_9FUNG|nr:hypothetical protein BDK51DRAFT_40399 [Blyttiomyces helicus]|eukprot:RKO92845.1 hypothetical protein BDK51DRAFT_40399 [Blyttiomyces helicus]